MKGEIRFIPAVFESITGPPVGSKIKQGCGYGLAMDITLLGERSEPHTGVFNRDFV